MSFTGAWDILGHESAPQQEHRLRVLCHESHNVILPRSLDFCDLPRGNVAETDLNDLWRMASNRSAGQKVIVLRDDDEPFVSCELPDVFVVLASKTHISYVTTTGKPPHKNINEAKRQILVNQRFHATDPRRRRSRSAANAKQARISSLVSSGKSARISASVMPAARYSSTSDTVMRSPRMQGYPLRLPGSIVMRSSSEDVIPTVYDWPVDAAKPKRRGQARCRVDACSNELFVPLNPRQKLGIFSGEFPFAIRNLPWLSPGR